MSEHKFDTPKSNLAIVNDPFFYFNERNNHVLVNLAFIESLNEVQHLLVAQKLPKSVLAKALMEVSK